MSDPDIILQLVASVGRRIRAHRLSGDIARGLSIVFIALVALKAWDLVFPLTGRTVATGGAIAAVFLIAYIGSRASGSGTLHEAAASIDERAGLHDEIRTAVWFIDNPRPSEWVARQIERAAGHA